jgi:hypothetical protein
MFDFHGSCAIFTASFRRSFAFALSYSFKIAFLPSFVRSALQFNVKKWVAIASASRIAQLTFCFSRAAH